MGLKTQLCLVGLAHDTILATEPPADAPDEHTIDITVELAIASHAVITVIPVAHPVVQSVELPLELPCELAVEVAVRMSIDVGIWIVVRIWIAIRIATLTRIRIVARIVTRIAIRIVAPGLPGIGVRIAVGIVVRILVRILVLIAVPVDADGRITHLTVWEETRHAALHIKVPSEPIWTHSVNPPKLVKADQIAVRDGTGKTCANVGDLRTGIGVGIGEKSCLVSAQRLHPTRTLLGGPLAHRLLGGPLTDAIPHLQMMFVAKGTGQPDTRECRMGDETCAGTGRCTDGRTGSGKGSRRTGTSPKRVGRSRVDHSL